LVFVSEICMGNICMHGSHAQNCSSVGFVTRG